MKNESQRKWNMEKEGLKQDDSRVLEVAMAAEHILLENGAEIARVEETMERICQHFGVESENFFCTEQRYFCNRQSKSGQSGRAICKGSAYSSERRAAG